MASTQPILVTGASGKTGTKVVAALAARGSKVRAFIRREDAAVQMREFGATETALGDLYDDESLKAALDGCQSIVHICPPMNPDETDIACRITDHCLSVGTGRLILYSVLHPLMKNVPHHDNKLQGERYLVNSGQAYTILQPSRYMQHLLPIWNKVMKTGIHDMPFSAEVKFSVVDLNDLAEATAIVATEDGHEGATYQLAGPEPLSQTDMAAILSELTGKEINAKAKSLEDFEAGARAGSMPEQRLQTMLKMNAHYNAHGLIGNSNVLRWILGREPATFKEFVTRDLLKT